MPRMPAATGDAAGLPDDGTGQALRRSRVRRWVGGRCIVRLFFIHMKGPPVCHNALMLFDQAAQITQSCRWTRTRALSVLSPASVTRRKCSWPSASNLWPHRCVRPDQPPPAFSSLQPVWSITVCTRADHESVVNLAGRADRYRSGTRSIDREHHASHAVPRRDPGQHRSGDDDGRRARVHGNRASRCCRSTNWQPRPGNFGSDRASRRFCAGRRASRHPDDDAREDA